MDEHGVMLTQPDEPEMSLSINIEKAATELRPTVRVSVKWTRADERDGFNPLETAERLLAESGRMAREEMARSG